MPLVSVIIPAYRASRYISSALESVFSQTWNHFEIVLVNDGSPDTIALESALHPFRQRLHYIEQPNQGPGAARNAGIHASRGDYLAFLDADDRWYADFLGEQMAFLQRRRDCDLVYCNALISGNTPLAGARYLDTAPSRGPVALE